jgi:uncharacterized protein (TIGR02996 family)
MPMQRDAALLAAVRAEPENDLPRLVYADWLYEHGEYDRSELIRVQCGMAIISANSHTCRKGDPNSESWCGACGAHTFAAPLHERSDEILRTHGTEWLTGIFSDDRRHAKIRTRGWGWMRGFVELVSIDSIRWLHCHEAILAHPDVVLRQVELTTPVPVKTQWTTHPARLRVWVDDHPAIGTVPAGNPHQPPNYVDLVRIGTVDMLDRRFPGHCRYRTDDGKEHYHPIKWVLPST